MSIKFDAPRTYDHTLHLFEQDGTITERVSAGLENVLCAYTQLAKAHAKETENNPRNYQVKDVFVVGSGAQAFVPDSDLDLLLEVPNLDEKSCSNIKMVLGLLFFVDRPKLQAVDPYIRPKDKYTERASIKITDQVQEMLQKYNSQLTQ